MNYIIKKSKKAFFKTLLSLSIVMGIIVLSIDVSANTIIGTQKDAISGYEEGKGETGYDYFYFGNKDNEPLKWRVLSDKGNAIGEEDTLEDEKGSMINNSDAFFILTDEVVSLTDNNSFPTRYKDSHLRSWCRGIISGENTDMELSDIERASILSVTKQDPTVKIYRVTLLEDTEGLQEDKLFLLSGSEVLNQEYGFSSSYLEDNNRVALYNEEATPWSLRQIPDKDPELFDESGDTTCCTNTGGVCFFYEYGATGLRPAANLYKDSILFFSAAESGKGDFGKVEENTTHEWKLTLKDDNSFADASIDSATVAPGKEVTITHKKLSELSADYTNVTAAISDKDGNLLYYGTVDTDVDATETKITIPADLPEATYTLSVYGEDWNGDKFTDYATGTPFETELVVDSKAEEATTEPATSPTTQPSTESTSTPKTTPAVKVGTAVTVGNLKYKVTSVKTNNPTVTITGMKNKKKTSVKIPATIKNKNVTYKVTAIANNAFKGNKKLKSVTIGKNVKSLGKNVFRDCKKLKKITVKTKVLKRVGANSLKGIHKKAVIKVPAKKKKAYKKLFKKKGQAKTVKIK